MLTIKIQYSSKRGFPHRDRTDIKALIKKVNWGFLIKYKGLKLDESMGGFIFDNEH